MIKSIVYSALKTVIPRPIRRKILQLVLPKRMTVTHREMGQSIRFVLYPSQQEDYGLIFGHELEARQLLPEVVQLGNVVFDVGAHYGLYTLLFAKLVSEQGQVHSFDPIAENIARLRENVQINKLNNVMVNECAVSNATGTTQINVGNSTKVSSIKSLSGQRQDWREVETITLDDYWVKVGRPKVKLIKIDVEGAESLVINGMKTLLRESSPHIMLEMHLFALDDAEKQVIIDILFAKNRYIARLLYVTDLGSKYRKIPKETFESCEGIKSYLADAHTAGLHLFPNSGRGASIESSSPHQ